MPEIVLCPSSRLEQELLLRSTAVLGRAFWLRDGQLIPMTLVEIAAVIKEFEPRFAEVAL